MEPLGRRLVLRRGWRGTPSRRERVERWADGAGRSSALLSLAGLASVSIKYPSSTASAQTRRKGRRVLVGPRGQRPVASHGPAQRQLLLRIGLAFFIEPLHIPVGADEAAHHRLGLAPAAGGDFRLPGLLVGGPLGIFGLSGLWRWAPWASADNEAEVQPSQNARFGGSLWSACTTSGCSMTKVVPS